MTHLRFIQLYDYVIGSLYTLKLINRTGFFSLRKILKTLKYPATADDIFLIGKYLEAKGFLKAIFTLGDVQIEITPSGIIHWEQNTNAHSEFNSAMPHDMITKLSNESSDTDTLEARAEIFENLKTILCFADKVRDQNPDLDIDAKILDLEFHKIKPDQEVILNKLYSIDQLPTIRKEVRYLKEALR